MPLALKLFPKQKERWLSQFQSNDIKCDIQGIKCNQSIATAAVAIT